MAGGITLLSRAALQPARAQSTTQKQPLPDVPRVTARAGANVTQPSLRTDLPVLGTPRNMGAIWREKNQEHRRRLQICLSRTEAHCMRGRRGLPSRRISK